MNRRENAVETLFPTVSEVPETVTGTRSRARQTKPLFQLQNTHPSLLPRNAPRLPRAPLKLPRTPSKRPVDPSVDRATRRASSDASRTREIKTPPPSRARFRTKSRRRRRRRRSDLRPSTVRRDPTDAHHRITKRSTRFAERVVAPATIEARVKEEEAGEFESRPKAASRRWSRRRGHVCVSIAPVG